jgi:hypothetical protein
VTTSTINLCFRYTEAEYVRAQRAYLALQMRLGSSILATILMGLAERWCGVLGVFTGWAHEVTACVLVRVCSPVWVPEMGPLFRWWQEEWWPPHRSVDHCSRSAGAG